MQALMALIVIPLILLNVVGGLAGGIWLLFAGEWRLVLAGIAYGVASPMVLGLVIMPTLIFAAPSVALMERGHITLGGLVALPGLAWTEFVLGGSCVLVVWLVTQQWQTGAPWPYLLWAYGTAVAPWAFLAQKDAQAGNDQSSSSLLFAQLGTISMLVATLINGYPLDWPALAMWCAPFVVLGLLLNWVGAMASAYRGNSLERTMRSLYQE